MATEKTVKAGASVVVDFVLNDANGVLEVSPPTTMNYKVVREGDPEVEVVAPTVITPATTFTVTLLPANTQVSGRHHILTDADFAGIVRVGDLPFNVNPVAGLPFA